MKGDSGRKSAKAAPHVGHFSANPVQIAQPRGECCAKDPPQLLKCCGGAPWRRSSAIVLN